MKKQLIDNLDYSLAITQKVYSTLDAIKDNEQDSNIDKKDRITMAQGYTQELNYNFEELKEVVTKVVRECIDYYWSDEGK